MDFGAAWDALVILMDPHRFLILCLGVAIGLGIAIIPGLGGIVGLAILIPFTYGMDAHTAFAFLIGMAAVTATSDVIPAVLFGVPGTVACAATVLDGYPLARRGEAGRALGACYSASLLGGIFGAALLALSIPILRPVMLYLGSPELLGFCFFGLSMVAVLSGRAPLKGMAAAGFGLMVAMIGADPQGGTLRWTFDQLYLWDRVPLVPVTLGLFALPELADLMIRRTAIAAAGAAPKGYSLAGQRQGLRDVLTHWWLVLRCSGLGAVLGAVPGMGASVIDWIAYGHAVRTEKNPETFGTGDIRGVIAAEASTNAREGGALVPTIAFGVPASASMALLLSAFLMHGLVPGPEMLTKNLTVTYAIIWSLVLAHAVGVTICVLASGQLARLAYVRFALLLPAVLAITFIGAFEGSHSWGDIATLIVFGIIGYVMKRLGWPRPPLILGFVLGAIFERYLFISITRYGAEWVTRPVVIAMAVLSLLTIIRPLSRSLADTFAGFRHGSVRRPRLGAASVFTGLVVLVVAVALLLAQDWPFAARIVPSVAAAIALLFATLNLIVELFGPPAAALDPAQAYAGLKAGSTTAGHGTIGLGQLSRSRAYLYFAWLIGFAILLTVVGFLPGIFLFILAFTRLEGGERWRTGLALAGGVTLACWLIFDRLVALPWPQSLLGDLFPLLRSAGGGLL